MRLLCMLVLAGALAAQQAITLPPEMVSPGAPPASAGEQPAAPPAGQPQAAAPGAPASPPPGVPAAPLPGLGGALPGAGGGQPMQQAPQAQEVPVVVVAIKATKEGRTTPAMDAELKPFAKVLDALGPQDTFELIAMEKKASPMGVETRFTVNGIYTAYVQPVQTVDTPEGGQRFDLQMRVEMLRGSDYIDAVRARGEAAPNQAMVLRGMDLDVAELVVVVMVSPEGDQGEQGNQQQEQQDQQQQDQQQQDQKPQQGGEQSEQDKQEEQEEQGEKDLASSNPDEEKKEEEQEGEQEAPRPLPGEQEQEQQQSPQEQDDEAQDGTPRDMETIEAILQNLEEKDRQEQRNARYRRNQVIVRGDWW
jgi:hypothetical protein